MTTPTHELLVCRTDPAELDPALRTSLSTTFPDLATACVGPRPGKAVDPTLTGSVVVVGDDADLAAVALRLLRTDRLGSVVLGFVPMAAGPVVTRFRLAVGGAALGTALSGQPQAVVMVRDDVGGVLLGEGRITPVGGPVYVDEHRLADVPTPELVVQPHHPTGVTVTATRRRRFGLGRAGTTRTGRATQIAGPGMRIVRDGVPYPREMDRWTWYRHTELLQLRLP